MKKLLLLLLLTSCTIEPLDTMQICECTEIYWRYLNTPPNAGTYEAMTYTPVGCVDEISIQDAIASVAPEKNITTITCIKD